MPEATISNRNQIVIPREVRKALGLKPGDRLLVVMSGNCLILRKKPKSSRKAISGIGRGLYPPDYLQKERESWD